MLAVLLTLALADAPVHAPAPACADGLPPGQRIGPAHAPAEVEAYLDPASTQTWRTWLELRRMVADHGGEVRLTVRWAGRGGVPDPQEDRVRAFVTALAERGHATEALRVVARDGLERLHARLVDAPSHEALAEELGVPLATVRAALDDRCSRRSLEATTEHLRRDMALDGGTVIRLPSFVVGELSFDDGVALDRLRPELGRRGRSQRHHEDPGPPPPPPPLQTPSERMSRPALPGLLLGGPGLPHRFVLMARDESDTSVFVMLPLALEQRASEPGRMAVHVVSRGVSSGAQELRHRLCAARVLGLGQAYLEYLGRDPMLRETPNPVDERLLADLDEVPASRCADEVDPVDLDLPDGAWLDGRPRSRNELGHVESILWQLEAGSRPLDLVFPAASDDL
ncbi:MAG: hypothetical protein H6712_08585 [Myxococcales bacterium]|nr:hypothetical protein [Myxococcales bacterium]MCB9713896.1 hypothetical protein [Myxococcales bacterium]